MASSSRTRTTRSRSPSRKRTTTRRTASGGAKSATASTSNSTPTSASTSASTSGAAGRSASADSPELLRKKELIDTVVARSGVRKRDAKPAVEAALALIGEALSQGRGMSLPQLGRLSVQRRKENERAQIVICKLRRNAVAPDAGKDPLAEAAD